METEVSGSRKTVARCRLLFVCWNLCATSIENMGMPPSPNRCCVVKSLYDIACDGYSLVASLNNWIFSVQCAEARRTNCTRIIATLCDIGCHFDRAHTHDIRQSSELFMRNLLPWPERFFADTHLSQKMFCLLFSGDHHRHGRPPATTWAEWKTILPAHLSRSGEYRMKVSFNATIVAV